MAPIVRPILKSYAPHFFILRWNSILNFLLPHLLGDSLAFRESALFLTFEPPMTAGSEVIKPFLDRSFLFRF